MEQKTEDEDWPTPGERSYSFADPPGPFRPLRRGALWLLAGVVGLVVLLLVAGLLLEDQSIYGSAIGGMLALPALGAVWLVLWVIDTILAYLKA